MIQTVSSKFHAKIVIQSEIIEFSWIKLTLREIYDQIFTLIYPDFKIKFVEVKAKRLLQPPHKTIFDEITINTMMHREGALYVPLHCGFLHFTEKFQAIRT